MLIIANTLIITILIIIIIFNIIFPFSNMTKQKIKHLNVHMKLLIKYQSIKSEYKIYNNN